MSQPEINPYMAPLAPSNGERGRREIVHALRIPSIGMLVLSLIWCCFAAMFVTVFAMLFIREFLESGSARGVVIPKDEAAEALIFVSSFFIAFGAWCMRRTIHYRVAVAAAVIACIPFLTPWIVLGIPFGIWALVVLRRKDVRAAFTAPPSTKY